MRHAYSIQYTAGVLDFIRFIPNQASAAYLIVYKLGNIANRLEIDHLAIACQDVWISSHATPSIHVTAHTTSWQRYRGRTDVLRGHTEHFDWSELLWHVPAARALAFRRSLWAIVTEQHGVT